jgi:acetyltransferase
MSLKNLNILFNPQRIAVIGASEDDTSIGYHIFRNLIGKGFKGIVHPVNPTTPGVQGVEAYRTVSDIPHPIDLALVATDPESLPAILNDCGRKGVKGVTILAPDNTSRVKQPALLREQIKKLSALYGCRVLGPNSIGFLRPAISLNASLYPKIPQKGNIAFISESGIFSTAFLEHAISKKVGFSYFISLGSKLDIDMADTIDFLGGDSGTRAIFLFLQTINNGRRFMTAVRNYARTKLIVVVKPGKTGIFSPLPLAGADPLTEEDLIYEAVFKRSGCLRVNSIVDLLYMVETIAKQNRPKGKRLMIVSNCHAPAVMAIDALKGMGGMLATPGTKTLERIRSGLSLQRQLSNPLYLKADASAADYRVAIANCLQDDNIDGVMVICIPFPGIDVKKIAQTIVVAARNHPKIPLFSTWFGEQAVLNEVDFINSDGIPTYYTPEQAVKSFMYMYRYDYNLKLLQETPEILIKDFSPKLETAKRIIGGCIEQGRYTLHADETCEILRSYGIPVIDVARVGSADEAVRAARRIGYPVAMKIDTAISCSMNRDEKVFVRLKTDDEVCRSFGILQDLVLSRNNPEARVIVQPMVARRGYELMIGAQKSRNFGTVISFGLGGKYFWAERDYSIGLPPLNQTLARRMMEETKIYLNLQNLDSFQGGLRVLEKILVRFSQLIIDLPQIGLIDINPLNLMEDDCAVRDAAMHIDERLPKEYQWAKGDLCPLHLSIPPYPFKYEKDVSLADGTVVHIRPIRSEDEPALRRFFETLSEESVFFRFGQRRINMPHDYLARFCQVDYDRDLAFLAVVGGMDETIIGDVRLNRFADLESAELSFIVADPWQSKGIGSLLMNFCIDVAREIGLKTLLMEIMKSNSRMMRFGYKYDFQRQPNNEDDDMEELQLELG